ncbi:MAG: hypothetical protein A3G70_07940 [Planctomycetes bacterium RIFCSPLOWO2_12_FULL_39_13]|nr:MAG: hypothetical protein A2Y09_08050 [Planctomycetes bacterium GWA2_39_15]OHB40053.1 MAG: hypothetical protein A2Y11_02930 [Planctomycetes bacterium GWC2_39_26]OHB99861.1 MAG: hypothetical protein A3G70_07940 [Planctomycetes bacterium RIFCSPLOWO2_12_FULL_39_13]
MIEEKGTSPEGQSSKKFVSGQKSSERKPQKEQPKIFVQPKPATDIGYASLLSKKIDDFVQEIEGKPLKSFEKKDQQKILESYEKLIFKVVREINNSRR